ncbi:hypothetical protein LY474_20095 [Myxococcus stipitatus]|uniref:hypothetical protein n=1 Tax=Myxococcus stipitatus TaxID=83455 RepID=UPI001F264DF9|nr:hypothetical protein [Myxococcus stipitatus]MCE9670103.1 hypothetical protein [Myxococcus stipitatus]
MRSILGGLLAVVGMMGCGGMEPMDEGSREGASPEVSAQALCDEQYIIKYYDKTYTSVLGSTVCECGQAPVFTGSLTLYPKKYTLGTCQ